jgi:hypothetical protein
MANDFKITELGTQIKVNKGEIETLIKIEKPYGLFKSQTGYKVVRNLSLIVDEQFFIKKDNNQLTLFNL